MAEHETELSLLREIRNALHRHQKYIEERDSKQNEYLSAESAKIEKATAQQKKGMIVWVLIVVALWMIAVIQLIGLIHRT